MGIDVVGLLTSFVFSRRKKVILVLNDKRVIQQQNFNFLGSDHFKLKQNFINIYCITLMCSIADLL